MYQKSISDYISEGMPLVNKIAGWLISQYPSTVDLDDLIQTGMEGLINAAQNYNPQLGIFSHYASTRIRGAIIDSLRHDDVLPRHMRDKVDLLKQHKDNSRETIKQKTGWTEDELIDVELASTWMPVDTEIEDGETSLLDLIPDTGDSPEGMVERKQLVTILVDTIHKLPEREQLIVSLYYDEDCNLKEIAAILDLTESRVSQLLKQTLTELRAKVQKYQ